MAEPSEAPPDVGTPRPETRGRGMVALPDRSHSPWWELGRRVIAAVGILVGTVMLVYFDGEGYRDGSDPANEISLIDAMYYTTVTLIFFAINLLIFAVFCPAV